MGGAEHLRKLCYLFGVYFAVLVTLQRVSEIADPHRMT
jgi:hypothetical protein